MKISTLTHPLPKWYMIAVLVLFMGYVGGWIYTIHLAQIERSNDEQYIMPVGPHDSFSYARLSESLLQGYFAEPGESYEYFHTPGYPAFVAAIRFIFNGSWFVVTFVQILLVFATALMTCELGQTLISERVGLWASLLFLVNPLVPFIALYVLTDILFMFLLTLGLLLLFTQFSSAPTRTALFAGLVFAAAIYVRPVGFLSFPILIAPILITSLSWKTKLANAVLMLCLVAALLFPWMVRNQVHSGVFSFSSLFPLNMAYYEIPHYLSWNTDIPLNQAILKVEHDSGVPAGFDARGYPANWYNLTSGPALDVYIMNIVWRSPLTYGFWHLYNSAGFFLGPAVVPTTFNQNLKLLLAQGKLIQLLQGVISPWWLFLERMGVLNGLLLVFIGFWQLRNRNFVWIFIFIILYFSALGGTAAAARLRLPVEPLLSIIMVVGISVILRIIASYSSDLKSKKVTESHI